MRQAVVEAIGGRAAPSPNTRVVFCKDTFDYPELEDHELLCNHLGKFGSIQSIRSLNRQLLFFPHFLFSTQMERTAKENIKEAKPLARLGIERVGIVRQYGHVFV